MNGAPLSGSHLGPHTRPLCPCNKAVFREAVCSSFLPFKHCLLIQSSTPCTEIINDKDEFSLTENGSPFRGLGSSEEATLEKRIRIEAKDRFDCFHRQRTGQLYLRATQ